MLMKSGIGRTDDKTKVIDRLPVNFDSGFCFSTRLNINS
jgi:hypothetical protein